MPRIEEYQLQTTAEGPVGGTSPMLEEVGAVGRGMQQFGSELTQNLDVLHQRQTQAEQSEVSSTISDTRLDFLNQVDSQTKDGTIDSKQIENQFDDFTTQQADKFDTTGGKNYFNRQTERLKASVMRAATRGQAMVAGANAKAAYTNELNNDTSVVSSHPDQYGDVLDSNMEKIGAMVDEGHLPAAQAEAYKNDVGKKLSQAAVNGIIQSDYNRATGQAQQIIDSAGPGAVPKAEALATLTKGFTSATIKMADGSYDNYLSAADKQALANRERTMQSDAVTEINRMVTVKRAAQQEYAQNYTDQNFGKISSGAVPLDTIRNNAQLPWQLRNQLIRVMGESTKAQTTDPVKYNETVHDISSGKISDPAQLLEKVGNGISTKDYGTLRNMIDTTPAGLALNSNRKATLDYMKKVYVDSSFMGKSDPEGQFALLQATQSLQAKEAEYRQQGKPVSSLYDTNSPDSFIKQLKPKSGSEYLKSMSAPGNPLYKPPQTVFVPPGSDKPVDKSVEQAGSAPVPPPKKYPPPGLTPQQFKAWRKANGG